MRSKAKVNENNYEFFIVFCQQIDEKRRETVLAAKIVQNRYPTRLRHCILSTRIDFGSILGAIWDQLFDYFRHMF